MSVVPPGQAPADRRLSPGLTINPGINNPFRRGPNSPALSPPLRPSSSHQPRPISRNPFLDRPDMPPAINGTSNGAPPTDEADDLFKTLSLNDKQGRNENMPPQVRSTHRPTRSQEEERRRQGVRPREPTDTLDIFADPRPRGSPQRRPDPRPRPRRNSDSSVADPEEERRRRERRHREREYRHRDSKGRPVPHSGPRPKRPNHRVDVIDKLDVTSIFGSGVFHHDGPFDACNPHRNRKGATRAPMQAFPKDSANNALGGSGPLRSRIDMAAIHGHQGDSYADFNNDAVRGGQPNAPVVAGHPIPSAATGPAAGGPLSPSGEAIPLMRPNQRDGADPRPGDRESNFNPTAKVTPLHGDESLGLGTSTFLEGAPAARAAIQRRESESEAGGGGAGGIGGGGLGRKKSLAQKIRGIGGAQRTGSQSRAPLGSPEARYDSPAAVVVGTPDAVQSAGGLPKITERNPFFQDYDAAYATKGARIREAEAAAAAGSALASPGEGGFDSDVGAGAGRVPRQAMTRRATEGAASAAGEERAEGAAEAATASGSGGEGKSGFLSRVKSLRGGGKHRTRPAPPRE